MGMFVFRQGAGAVVAADVQNAVASVDDALLSGARMCVSVLEAAQGSTLPPAQSQKVLRSITAGMTAVVEGRAEIVAAVRALSAIKAQSNFAPEGYGCPGGWSELSATADAPVPERAPAA
jgi:hypothetical protein